MLQNKKHSPKGHLPQVVFGMPTIREEARTFVWFCRPRPTGWDWSSKVYYRHPELEKILSGITDVDVMYSLSYSYARQFRKEHLDEFEKLLLDMSVRWRVIERSFLSTLAEHFEIDFPSRRKYICAYLSMVPIYPRELETWSFNVGYFAPDRMCNIACHEILHFIYFRKWMHMFPGTKYEACNSPHLVWRLSEILDPVILNEHPTFASLLGGKQSTYKEFEVLQVEGVSVMDFYTDLYRSHLKSGDSFETFLRKSWDVAQEHSDVFLKA